MTLRPSRSPPRTRARTPIDDGPPSENGDTDIPCYQIDLDSPPEERWSAVAAAYHVAFDHLIHHNREALAEFENTLRYMPARLLLQALPLEHRADVLALSTLLGVPLGMLALLQLVYEAFSLDVLSGDGLGCTAIVVSSASSPPLLARTLDWAWLDGLDDLLVELVVVRSGRPLYRCTSFVGYVGVLTGMRYQSAEASTEGDGGYAICINYRKPYPGRWLPDGTPDLDRPPWQRNGVLRAAAWHALRGGWPVASLLRDVLERCASYAEARATLLSARLVAPCYLSLVGTQASEG